MKKWQKVQLRSEYLADGLSIILAILCAYLIIGLLLGKIMEYTANNWIQYFLLLFASYTIVFAGFASPLNLEKRSRVNEALSVLRNTMLTYMLFAVLLLLFKNPMIESRYLFIGSFFIFVFFSGIFKYALKRILTNNFSHTRHATMVGVLTTRDRADEFIEKLQNDWTKSIKGVAIIKKERDLSYIDQSYSYASADSSATTAVKKSSDSIKGVDVIEDVQEFLGWVRVSSVDEVYINLPMIGKKLDALVEELEDMGVTVHVNLPSLENFAKESKFDNVRCEMVADYPMVSFSAAVHSARCLAVKRLMDIAGGLVGLIFSIPVILVTAVPLLIETPGPLFFKQQRVGRNGRVFNMYKLRSMYTDAEERKKEFEKNNTMNGLMFKMENDPRITKVGKVIRKYSIDELPQFFNVLKGDMSLVGTRPPTLDEFTKYSSHHKRRLSMRPGITGMWQVSGRSDIHDFEEVVKLDCEYIDNWSLLTDIKILFKTVKVVFTGKGAK